MERGVAEVIVRAELEALLKEGRALRLKMGFDPSRPDIHLGHAVGLRKLRKLQDLGHQVVLIVGDWTAQIGDPSGQSVTRPMLTAEEVKSNADTYMDQFFKVMDKERTEVRWQSEWFGNFDLGDVIKLTSNFTVAQLLARDDFSKRYAAQKPIALTEFLYPLLQAYDSVAIEADVEFGGTDQKFNLLLGRELQGIKGQRPQYCFLVPILVGTDGSQRMSKSLGNYIGIDEQPKEIYFKVMRLKDEMMMDYFELVTDVPDGELEDMRQALASSSVNPMEIKKRLAREIVAQFHDPKAAQAAEAAFEKVVQGKESSDNVIDREPGEILARARGSGVNLQVSLPQLLFREHIVPSASEGRRMIDSGGVEVNGTKITSYTLSTSAIKPGVSIKAGKRYLIRIVHSKPVATEYAEPGPLPDISYTTGGEK